MDPIAVGGPALRVVEDVSPPELVVRLVGELDLACADIMQELGRTGLGSVRRAVVDLSELSFCDSTGIDFLIELQSRAAADGREVTLVHAQPLVRKVCAILGEDHCLAA